MLDSILESLHVLSLPTKTDFRGVTFREVALFEGPAGWAEFSPFLEYDENECIPWLVSAVESATQSAPAPIRDSIPVNATLPAVNGIERISEILSWYPGCSTVKIKAGKNLQEDLQRIEHVRMVVPNAKIRIDVNGAWSVEEAIRAISEIHQGGIIEYVEQPCSTIEDLRKLKKLLKADVLIAGDEVLRKSPKPLDIDLNGVVDILMLKVAPLGGISQSLRIAKKHGLPVVVSSALESAIGISYGLKLAAVLPELPFACGLGTGQLLGADVASLGIIDGAIAVGSPSPEAKALDEYATSLERLDYWKERIRKTWVAGAQDWIAKEGWVW